MLERIQKLLLKEIQLELRQKYAINGIILYIVSTVFISYLSFKSIISPPAWNALFWMILLFASVNASAKSFNAESRNRFLYIYSLISPQELIISKILYNILLMLMVSFICFACYSLFIGNLVEDTGLFLLNILLGSIGLSSLLTLVSAIASKTNNNFSIMAILSFPIIVPLLMVLIRISKNAVDGLSWSISNKLILTLGALDMVIIALVFMLFPYLWKE